MKKLCAIATIDLTLSSFVVEAMRKLKEEGYDVTLIASMSEAFVRKHGVEFHCINLPMSRGTNPWEIIVSVISFYRIFRKEKFDYIQYATPNASFYASIASFLARCPIRVYCQWGIRYVGFKGMKRTLFKVLERITCGLSTHIRPASQKNLLFAVQEGLYRQQKARVIGAGGTIGVDFEQFDKSQKSHYKQEVLSEYALLEGKFVFGFVGRMDRDKGVTELFAAFLNICSRCPSVALLLVGPEDKIEGIDVALYRKVKETGNAVFTGFTKDVPKFISAFDVLVHPSYREGFSMVIQQAMAMEVAVVTTDIPGPSEVIEENVSGILVPAKDAVGLERGMERIRQDSIMRESMAREAYVRARRLFNRERMLRLTCIDRKEILHDL